MTARATPYLQAAAGGSSSIALGGDEAELIRVSVTSPSAG
jgi:hypothetical protein